MNGWKIVVPIPHRDGLPPVKEHYLVAIADREESIAELGDREKLTDAQITVAGEAGPDWLDWLQVGTGEILFIRGHA